MPYKLLIALALFLTAPAALSAKEPAGTEAQLSALVEINAVFEEQGQAVARIAPITRRLAQGTASPEAAAAVAREIGPAITELRQFFERSTARLVAIDTPAGAIAGDLSLRDIVEDGRRQNDAVITLLDDARSLLDAAARRDRVGVQRLAGRLVQSTGLLVRNQALVMQVRQAQVEKTESTHQSLGILVNLYRAMAIAVERGTGQAASGSFMDLSSNIRQLVRDGRENLARERAEAAAMSAAAGGETLVRILDLEANYLTAGEALAERLGALDAGLGTPAGAMGAVRELAEAETRLQAIASEQIAAAAALR